MKKPADLQDVERFQAAITTRTGLLFDDSMKPETLEKRIRVTRKRDAADHLRELAVSRREAMELVGALTVSETYFLRNSDQFRVVESWLRGNSIRLQKSRRLRILSAGCASGEEPFSLAMVLCENLPNVADWDVPIYGVDINPGVFEKAKAGRYSAWSLRETRHRRPRHLRRFEVRAGVGRAAAYRRTQPQPRVGNRTAAQGAIFRSASAALVLAAGLRRGSGRTSP